MTAAADIAAPAAAPRRRLGPASVVGLADAAPIARAWAALAATAVEDNIFFHPEFALPAMAAFGGGRVTIATVGTRARLLAAAPFVVTRLGRLAPAARVWSHKFGPLGAPLLDPDDPDKAAAGLLAVLSPPHANRAVILPDLPLDGPAAAALAQAARSTRRSTVVLAEHNRAIALRGDAEIYDPDAGLSRHRRHEYARQLRRLEKAGDVVFEVASEPDAVADRFEDFLALEASGWKGGAGTALASDPSRLAFARRAVAARAAAGAVRMTSIRFDGRAIASLVSFIAGRTAFTWKIAYDESFARYSPGAQVMLAALGSHLGEPGMERVDSCAGPNHTLVDPLLPDRMAVGTFIISPAGEGGLYRAGLTAARLELAAANAARRARSRLAALRHYSRRIKPNGPTATPAAGPAVTPAAAEGGGPGRASTSDQ